jgi:hypothetical protein
MADLINGLGGPAGFGETDAALSDDDATPAIDLTPVFPDGLNFFGTTYDEIFVNSNGNLTFEREFFSYSPRDIATLEVAGLYPFWTDVNVAREAEGTSPGGTSTGSNAIWYDLDPEAGTFTVTWDDVTPFSYNGQSGVNAFQIRLVNIGDAPGQAQGDFRIELRYEQVDWTFGIGSAEGATARVGFTIGDGISFVELDASNDGDLLRLLPGQGVLSFVFDADGVRGDATFDAIGGTLGNDRIEGTDEGDVILPGAGRDTILPGLGEDSIFLEGGANLVAGTAEELLGDRLFGADWDDALLFEGLTLDPGAFAIAEGGDAVTVDLDGDGDGAAEGRVELSTVLRGGSLLTAQAEAGTFLGYVRDLPALEEGVRVADPARLNGDRLTEAYLTGDGVASFALHLGDDVPIAAGTALGVYEVDATGALVDARLLTTDAAAEAGTTFAVDGVEAGHELAVFVLRADDPVALDPDGFAFVNEVGDPATLDDRNYVFAAQDGAIVAGELFHAFDARLNQDTAQHALIARDPDRPGLTLAFEDEMFGVDADFADLVLSVERLAVELG